VSEGRRRRGGPQRLDHWLEISGESRCRKRRAHQHTWAAIDPLRKEGLELGEIEQTSRLVLVSDRGVKPTITEFPGISLLHVLASDTILKYNGRRMIGDDNASHGRKGHPARRIFL
jgi:hypothetical protein